MTQNYSEIKTDLLNSIQQLSSLFKLPQTLSGMANTSFSEWEKACDTIRRQLSDEWVRVAVVGSIKSGKSTFVNSLLGGDHLKRGAGVVTSIVTRVRRGKALKATLFLKSWDHVNRDIIDALVLLPNLDRADANEPFDLRRSADRQALRDALGALNADQMITNDARNANAVLLSSYLDGFDRVKDLIGPEPATRVFDQKSFETHRAFVGEDALAVYLTDIEIEIDSPGMAEQIEIADCQGSDSSNPLHLAMIQDYLNLTHLIIYVISSRTGLRRADIRFLSMIKKMGISDNILFIINADFNEHATVDELRGLVKKSVQELALIKPDPRVFTLSALFSLFRTLRDNLLEKDKRRYEQWETEQDLTAFSDDHYNRFLSTFHEKVTAERYAVLLQNHLERAELIIEGLDHWEQVNRKMVLKGTEIASQTVERIEQYQDRVAQIRTMMQSTLDGTVARIKRDMKIDVDRFFGDRSAGLMGTILDFIKAYNVPLDTYAEDLERQGFNSTMYRVFQDFRQALDTFVAENVNPRIIGYVREAEDKFGQHLKSVAGPYDIMIQDAMTEFSRSMVEIGIPPMNTAGNGAALPDTETIRGIAGIQLPPAIVTMQYSAKIKTEAVMRLGFYTALTLLKQLLKKPLQSEHEKEMNALADGIRRMRRETEKSVVSHFIDYKENLKFQYILKLADAVSNAVKETLLNRFQSYVESLLQMMSLISTNQLDKADALGVLDEMGARTAELRARLFEIRASLGLGAVNSERGG